MTTLNQIIAVSQGKKSNAKKVETEAYNLFKKPELFNGLVRKYEPKNDEGETLPAESKNVQFKVDDVLKNVNEALAEMFDVVLQQDHTNCSAVGDIVVGGETIASDVPATTLIFLEKQLNDLSTLVGSIPTLDLAEEWRKDEGKELYVSSELITNRTVKQQVPLVLYDATDKHPAQTQLVVKDEIAGHWKTTKTSGSWTNKRKTEVLDRIRALKDAVIFAREEANKEEVEHSLKLGKKVLSYVFGNNLV